MEKPTRKVPADSLMEVSANSQSAASHMSERLPGDSSSQQSSPHSLLAFPAGASAMEEQRQVVSVKFLTHNKMVLAQ